MHRVVLEHVAHVVHRDEGVVHAHLWKSTSEVGYNFTPSSRRDGVLRPKFYFHTDGTMLMLGFDCAARMTRRPILPNPLIPTRIDMLMPALTDWVIFKRRRVDSV